MDEVRDPRRAPGRAPDPASGRSPGRPGLRSSRAGGQDPIEQRLERWVSRGREFVDGVSGARPGARGPAGGPSAGFNPGGIGRWVEERLDWLLDDDGEDDWREPWQDPASRSPRQGRSPLEAQGRPEPGWEPERQPQPRQTRPPREPERPPGAERGLPTASSTGASPAAPAPRARRRALEAISRRAAAPEAEAGAPADRDAWPDEASFSLNRWQRPQPVRAPDPLQASALQPPPTTGGGRPLPRSTRRRD